MRPHQRDLDDEIRGHLALAIRDRIERGEEPAAARLAALRELGYVPAVRESMRRVWFGRWADAGHALAQDLRIAARSLARTKALAVTVVVTLALGIGANAAIFSVANDQPIARAATLADVRAEVLEPERLTAVVVGAFAGVALVIAAVGIAGVLAFSVSARTREFGVRLALGATPARLLVRVLGDGAVIVLVGVAGGAAAAGALWRLDTVQVGGLLPPGAIPMLGAAGVLAVTALLAALVPAARAARVNVVEALRSE